MTIEHALLRWNWELDGYIPFRARLFVFISGLIVVIEEVCDANP